LTLFTSIFQHHDDQDFDFFRSTELRYEEPFALFNTFVDLDFFKDTSLSYQSDNTTLILGGNFQIAKRTEMGLAYTFTRTNTSIDSGGLTANTIDGWSRFRNDIHRVQFDIGHWLREGLRVSFGYSYDKYDDRTQVPTGVGSADPFDPSTHVHTFMFGVTMNSDLLR
jgi:outer membrane receptor for ferric coprogen and ferric-rhodotorulic acid